MIHKFMNPVELQMKFQPALVDVFDITILDDLKTDIEENEILNPIILSKDEIPIDGFRRINVSVLLGLNEIPVVITDMEASVENRIALNNYREFTWKDLRNLYILLFTLFGKRQGKRSSKHFDRYEEIANRTKNRFKDKETLKSVEYILNNDTGEFTMSRWLFEKNSDVKSIKTFIELMVKGGYDDIVEQVLKMELSPKDAVRQINDDKGTAELKYKAFTLPETKVKIAEVRKCLPEELLISTKKNSVQIVFYHPDEYVLQVEDTSWNYKRMMTQPAEVYAQKAVHPLRPFEDRVTDGGSVYVFSKEHYNKGFAMQIPSSLIHAITEETGLVYKQTLYVSADELLTEPVQGKNLADSVTQILWFVKNPKEADKVFDEPVFVTNVNENSDSSLEQEESIKTCTNMFNGKIISKLLKEKGVKMEDVKYPAALIPILVASKEEDLVIDLSLKADIGSVAVLMNRRFIGISNSKSSVDLSVKRLIKAVEEFNPDMAKSVTQKKGKKVKEPELVS